MKRIIQETTGEGLDSLLGERVILLCAAYFYEGELVGVNEHDVVLKDPHIVFSAGSWEETGYSNIESIKHADEWIVRTASIESYGKSKR